MEGRVTTGLNLLKLELFVSGGLQALRHYVLIRCLHASCLNEARMRFIRA